MGTVLITGCSSGFGQAAALALARRGQSVMATMRNPADGKHLLTTAEQEQLSLSVHPLDVLSQASIDSALETILAEEDRIDALVNNAGQRGPRGPVTTFSDSELHNLFDVNVVGMVRMARAVVPSMIARGAGRIVNVSSMAGLTGVPFESAYCISKHGVEALSEALRWELAPHGITVSVIEPGAYNTSFFAAESETAGFGPDHPERPVFDQLTAAINRTMITGRLQDPDEVAEAICDAVTSAEDGFRRVVGQDAVTITSLKHELPYEEFERQIRAIFGLDTPSEAVAGSDATN